MPPPPVVAVCAAAGLDPTGTRLLHDRANAVYHVPAAAAVVRLRRTRGDTGLEERLARSVTLVGWLVDQGFPAVPPLPLGPVRGDGWFATFWRYIDTSEARARPGVADLAALLRTLHALPSPPVELAATDPLGSLSADLDHYGDRLSPDALAWLRSEAQSIAAAYRPEHIPLGCGLVHGDARTGNLLAADGGWLLGDWDAAAYGPRAHDLAPILVGVRRWGLPRSTWVELCRAYGADPDLDQDPGVQLLARARELRSCAAYIRTADRPPVRAELGKRLRTLMTGTAEQWAEA